MIRGCVSKSLAILVLAGAGCATSSEPHSDDPADFLHIRIKTQRNGPLVYVRNDGRRSVWLPSERPVASSSGYFWFGTRVKLNGEWCMDLPYSKSSPAGIIWTELPPGKTRDILAGGRVVGKENRLQAIEVRFLIKLDPLGDEREVTLHWVHDGDGIKIRRASNNGAHGRLASSPP